MGSPARPDQDQPRIEVADILRDHAERLSLDGQQARVVRALVACRTATLGGHLQTCDHCGYSRPVYNSCRNRHCPKCQVLKQELWAEAEERTLLPTAYFHVVFTVPAELHPLFRKDPRACFNLFFEATARTLLEVACRRLGARIGFTAVLHTWTQKLLFHPHLHCIVSGGGLGVDGTRWMSGRENFLVPVRVLRLVFRGKLLSKLERALDQGEIGFPARSGKELLRKAAKRTWVVYAKRPLAGPEQVLRYVSRYTHRIAISNSRLVAYDGRNVTFLWHDRADGNRKKRLTLAAPEFARRFLLHVLPRALVRIRHYGLLSNRTRRKDLAQCRLLLASEMPPEFAKREDWTATYQRIFDRDPLLCPACAEGRLTLLSSLPPQEPSPRPPPPGHAS